MNLQSDEPRNYGPVNLVIVYVLHGLVKNNKTGYTAIQSRTVWQEQ